MPLKISRKIITFTQFSLCTMYLYQTAPLPYDLYLWTSRRKKNSSYWLIVHSNFYSYDPIRDLRQTFITTWVHSVKDIGRKIWTWVANDLPGKLRVTKGNVFYFSYYVFGKYYMLQIAWHLCIINGVMIVIGNLSVGSTRGGRGGGGGGGGGWGERCTSCCKLYWYMWKIKFTKKTSFFSIQVNINLVKENW